MSVVVPAKPKPKKLQVSYTVRPRRPPRIYVEYLDENGAVIKGTEPATPPDISVSQTPEDAKPTAPASTNTKGEDLSVPYTSQDAGTQTDFFWCTCPKQPFTEFETQSAKKQSRDKDSRATAPGSPNPAKEGVEAKSKQSKSSRSEADVLALLEQATRRKSNLSKEPKAEVASAKAEKPTKKSEKKETAKAKPDKQQPETEKPVKKQPGKKQPAKGQSGKKQSEEQRAKPPPPKQVHFNHLPRFRDPHRNPASSSSSSASDESNIDPSFAASVAQAPPPGYVSQMQEPELYGTPAQHARYEELRHENDMIRCSVNYADNLERVRKVNEEAAAGRADETAAQQWLRDRTAEASQAAASWLGERQAARSQTKGITPHREHEQAELRMADEREAARWVEQRAKKRHENLANRNGSRSETKSPHHQDLNAEGYRKSPSQEEIVWDETRNANWTRPSEWTNLSQPQKSSLSKSAPRIWDDTENNVESQARRVSFASPNRPTNSDPREGTEGRFLNEMDMNTTHIPPYRRYTELNIAQGPSLYRPHSGRRSAYESLPDPIFIMNPSNAAAQSSQRSLERDRAAPVVAQRYEMSGALHDSDACIGTKTKNKKRVHYEAPSVASADSNEEDPNNEMLWVE
ncbi:conserved oligomeric Golgi complex component [Xylographa vitiligo]|nr:conserved oligomeric Golgi complex component [Xylographa vitiligo]